VRETEAVSLAFGPFRLRADGVVLAGESVLPLTPTEERFLRVLVQAEGLRVTKDVIAEQVWPRATASDASLSRCVHTLRRKLEAVAPAQPVIATCYGRGYRLVVPVARGVDRTEPARAAATVSRFPDRRGLAAVPSRPWAPSARAEDRQRRGPGREAGRGGPGQG
jgi:DNA-binding winged helix-turn-helix (wHTH) protein